MESKILRSHKSCYIITVIAIFLLLISIFKSDSGSGDFFSYWYGAKLLLLHSNPYNWNLYQDTYQVLFLGGTPSHLFAPPYVLFIISWLSLLDYESAWNLWMLCNVSLFVYLIVYLNRRGEFSFRLITFLISFLPIILSFMLGQMTLIPFFGLVLLLSHFNKNPVISALGMTLLLLKLHTFFPIIFASLLFANSTRIKFFVTFIISSCILIILPEFFSPGIYAKFLTSFPSASVTWKNPTLGALFHEYSGYSWTRFLPSICLLGYIFWLRAVNKPCNLIFQILPLCIVCSPYIWTYDFVFLIPTLLGLVSPKTLFSTKEYSILSILITLNVCFLLSGLSQWALWYPICILALSLGLLRKLEPVT